MGIKSLKFYWPQLKNRVIFFAFFCCCFVFVLTCLRVSKFSGFESSKINSTFLGSSSILFQTTTESTGKWEYEFLRLTKLSGQNKAICIPDSNVQTHHLGYNLIRYYKLSNSSWPERIHHSTESRFYLFDSRHYSF